jgi:anti-sigma28 factor (negative regulator of flagellin synthesis)
MTSFGAQQANRVQELSTLYDSGQYKVEAAAVSKAMVESALAAAPE